MNWNKVIITSYNILSSTDFTILNNNSNSSNSSNNYDEVSKKYVENSNERYKRRFDVTLHASMKVRLGDDGNEAAEANTEGGNDATAAGAIGIVRINCLCVL